MRTLPDTVFLRKLELTGVPCNSIGKRWKLSTWEITEADIV